MCFDVLTNAKLFIVTYGKGSCAALQFGGGGKSHFLRVVGIAPRSSITGHVSVWLAILRYLSIGIDRCRVEIELDLVLNVLISLDHWFEKFPTIVIDIMLIEF